MPADISAWPGTGKKPSIRRIAAIRPDCDLDVVGNLEQPAIRVSIHRDRAIEMAQLSQFGGEPKPLLLATMFAETIFHL